MLHHKEIEITGSKIAYYESPGKGQPVLFIHGNSMSSLSFERQFESSLGEKYHLIALDLPGHGKSAPAQEPKSAYTLPGYADIVCAFVQKLEIENAVFVGWSLGGHILLEAIGRLQKSIGLMIFGAPPVRKSITADVFIPHPLMSLTFKNVLNNEEATTLTAAYFMPGRQIPEFFFEDMRRTDGRAREALGICLGTGSYSDEVKIAAEFNKPLAIVHGEQDPVVNLSYIKGLSIPTRGDATCRSFLMPATRLIGSNQIGLTVY